MSNMLDYLLYRTPMRKIARGSAYDSDDYERDMLEAENSGVNLDGVDWAKYAPKNVQNLIESSYRKPNGYDRLMKHEDRHGAIQPSSPLSNRYNDIDELRKVYSRYQQQLQQRQQQPSYNLPSQISYPIQHESTHRVTPLQNMRGPYGGGGWR